MIILPDDKQPDKPEDVRDAILKLLAKNEIEWHVGVEALQQSLTMYMDFRKLTDLAHEQGHELSGFRTDDNLELYCDVKRNNRPIGCLYKGWGDPGFRLEEMVPITANNMIIFEAQAPGALLSLASNGMGVSFCPMDGGGCFLQMTTVLYQDGFNTKTVAAAVQTLSECTDKVKNLLA